MQPEFAAYQDSAHSRVPCVDCHIGSGASWFVKAKISGARQVLAVITNSHSRPIPSPVHDLRPARDTCMTCHWPEKFHGDMIKTVKEYADDEQNTETATTMRIHVGGGSEKLGLGTGIHWHMNASNEIDYIATDDKRQVIPYVRMKDASGVVREYFAEGVDPATYANLERRRMDCMDCHNRPSHAFAGTSSRAVNRAIEVGTLPRELPFVKREVVAAIEGKYANQDAGSDEIAAKLREVYRKNYGQLYMEKRELVERAVTEAQRIYRRNIFPSMNVTWGSYPNNIGHMDFPGCFRCHDETHKTKDGRAIGQDCELCHKMEE
jgi:heat shock protein HspQ